MRLSTIKLNPVPMIARKFIIIYKAASEADEYCAKICKKSSSNPMPEDTRERRTNRAINNGGQRPWTRNGTPKISNENQVADEIVVCVPVRSVG